MTFAQSLNRWYKKSARELPWRKTRDPYKIWISEIMLQQTTVNAVIPYYERWVKAFPSVESVAKAREQKILKLWQGLGYYSRARNIHKSAQLIVSQHKGKVPQTADELRALPGFGPYTVGAVLSIAFDKREPIVDANVRRVAMRILAKKGAATTAVDKDVLVWLDMVMPQRNLSVFNQALMELGALVCRNREPICLLCPVKQMCKAYEKGIQEIIPTPQKKVIKDVDVAIGLIKKNGKYLIQQRPPKGLLANLWEFPGGKVEPGESPKDALKRELSEEVGVKITAATHLMNVRHYYTQFRVNLHVFNCKSNNILPKASNQRWTSLKGLVKYPMPSGSARIVERLINP